MTDTEIIAAIRADHLLIGGERDGRIVFDWSRATVDPGGTIWGPGPYLHVPIVWCGEEAVIRVHAPERLRRRLAKT